MYARTKGVLSRVQARVDTLDQAVTSSGRRRGRRPRTQHPEDTT